MPNNLERFTEYAKEVLNQAQLTAEAMPHKNIDVQHVFLAMVKCAGLAGEIWRCFGLDIETTKGWTRKTYVDGALEAGKSIQVASGTQRLLERAVDEARRRSQTQICTGHLLLGMLVIRHPIMDEALAFTGLNYQQLISLTDAAMLAYTDAKDLPRLPRTIPPEAAREPSGWNRLTSDLIKIVGVKAANPAAESEEKTYKVAQMRLIAELISSQKDNARLYYYRARVNHRRNEYAAAEQDYNEVIRLKSDWAMAYCYRGSARLSAKNYDGAIADFTKMIDLKVPGCAGYTNRGLTYLSKYDYEQAMNDFEAALRINPFNMRALSGRASIYLFNREFNRAIAEYDTYLSRDPKSKVAINNRATALAYKGELDKAEADFRELLRLDPENSCAHSNLGWLALLRKDYSQTIMRCNEAIRLDAKNGSAYFSRGAARAAYGNTAGAVADFRLSLIYWEHLKSRLGAPYEAEMRTYLAQWDKPSES